MEQSLITSVATKLHNARLEAAPVEQFGNELKKDEDQFEQRDAYSIQEEGISLREKMGEKVIALKMGLTSEAKRKQMDLDFPLYGVLTDSMEIKNTKSFSMKGTIHPKIEPEIAFFITKNLSGKVSSEDVLDACGGVCAALEILDSRYKQFKYFSMEEVISDNSSSSHYILGPKRSDFREIDLAKLGMKMLIDGKVIQEGYSHAISGDPIISVIQLCELLEKRGRGIPANTWVLAGAATPAAALSPGMSVELLVEGFGNVEVKITE